MNLEEYNLELERIIKETKKQKAKLVCLQLPDGLKPRATEIASEIELQTGTTCLIWLGSCFGACDILYNLQNLGIDLVIQFGHSTWKGKK